MRIGAGCDIRVRLRHHVTLAVVLDQQVQTTAQLVDLTMCVDELNEF